MANYKFLNRDVIHGFDFSNTAVLKPIEGKEDFEIVPMEWGFIPAYLKTREAVSNMRNGYKDAKGIFRPPMITLNAVSSRP